MDLSEPRAAGLEPAAEATASVSPESRGIRKIVVAIHGMGSQRRNDTVRAVAKRFGERHDLPIMPLGYFSVDGDAEVLFSRLDVPPEHELATIGFAEVYWADIPRSVVNAADTLEEAKEWGASIVSRARMLYHDRLKGKDQLLTARDFQAGAAIVEEVVETIGVLEKLMLVVEQVGLARFSLGRLLRDSVGDVQLVAEFQSYRERILHRFHHTVSRIVNGYRQRHGGCDPQIYLVAHSEGSVVALLALLQALSGTSVRDPDDRKAQPVAGDWVRCVRGFMTIGSPIDKHILLWPRLWQGHRLDSEVCDDGRVRFGPAEAPRLVLPGQIRWRNYYDFGDPIGAKVKSAARLLEDKHCTAFEFDTRKHDIGFNRYLMPGKAHTDYWKDPEVFEHFIRDVVSDGGDEEASRSLHEQASRSQGEGTPRSQPITRSAPPASSEIDAYRSGWPRSKALYSWLSLSIPYLLVAGLHFAAAFVLYKWVLAGEWTTRWAAFQCMVGLGGLLICMTVAARVPRLAKVLSRGRPGAAGGRWLLVVMAAGVLGAVCVLVAAPEVARQLRAVLGSSDDQWGPTAILLLVVAALLAISGWIYGVPSWGRRVPVLPKLAGRFPVMVGALILAGAVLDRLLSDGVDFGEAASLLLGGTAFLLLWWLGMLLFGLAFVWHRYLRASVAVEAMRSWQQGHDAQPLPRMGLKRTETPG
jgi:hypothetical protein